LSLKGGFDLKRIQDEVRAILSNEQGLDEGYYTAHYTAKERRQLSKALNQTLWEEVVLFRTCIKQFFGLTSRNSEQLDLQTLSGVVDTLAYDLKPDGSLAIIDYKGRKLIYPQELYQPFLDEILAAQKPKPKSKPKSNPAKSKAGAA